MSAHTTMTRGHLAPQASMHRRACTAQIQTPQHSCMHGRLRGTAVGIKSFNGTASQLHSALLSSFIAFLDSRDILTCSVCCCRAAAGHCCTRQADCMPIRYGRRGKSVQQVLQSHPLICKLNRWARCLATDCNVVPGCAGTDVQQRPAAFAHSFSWSSGGP